MRCAECGSEITRRDARYCGICGGSIRTTGGAGGLRGRLPARPVLLVAGVVLVLGVAVAAVVAPILDRGDGATPSMDPPADRETEIDDVVIGLDEAWSVQVDGGWLQGAGPPAWGHGRVYTLAGGALFALDASDGTLRWRYGPRNHMHVGPAVAGDLVVIGEAEALVGVDADSGERVWRTELARRWWEHLLGASDVLVTLGHHGTPTGLLATVGTYDVSTGAERWIVDLEGEWAEAPPVRVDGVVVTATHTGRGGHVRGLDIEDGSVHWEVPTAASSRPFLLDGVIHAVSIVEAVAVDPATGEELWRTDLDLPLRGAGAELDIASVDGELIVVAGEPDPRALGIDPDDGDVIWTRELSTVGGGGYDGPPLTADRPVIVRPELAVADGLDRVVGVVPDDRDDGVVRALTLDDEEIWTSSIDAPVHHLGIVADGPPGRGAVWLTTSYGELVALDPEDGTPTWRARFPAPIGDWVRPPASDGRLVVVNEGDRLTGIGAVDGEVRWSFDESQSLGTRAIGPHGSVFVPSGRRLAELDPDGGAVIAEVRPNPPIEIRDLAAGADRIVLASDSRIAAVDTTHRRQIWSRRVDDQILDLTVSGGHLALVTQTGVLLIDLTDGEDVWDVAIGGACTPPVIAGDVVALGTDDGVVALDVADGRERWRIGTTRPSCVPLAASGEQIHLTDLVRGVTAVAAADGTERWRARIPAGIVAPVGSSTTAVAVADAGGLIHILALDDGATLERLSLPAPARTAPIVHRDGIVVLVREGGLHAVPIGAENRRPASADP